MSRPWLVGCLSVALTHCGGQPSRRSTETTTIDLRSSATASDPPRLAEARPPASADPSPSHDASSDPRAPRAGWPLPEDCTSPERCTLPSGELGVTCEDHGPCLNPCPKGLAPNKEGTFCEHPCKVDHDCPGGTCSEEGLCDSFPVFSCSHVRDCALPDGHTGAQCKKSEPCVNPCKVGLFQTKTGECAKPCASNTDCPGGTCMEGFCGPFCPSKGCPYPWE